MPATNSKGECGFTGNESRGTQTRCINKNEKRRSCHSMGVIWRRSGGKKLKKEAESNFGDGSSVRSNFSNCSYYKPPKPNNRLVIEELCNSVTPTWSCTEKKTQNHSPECATCQSAATAAKESKNAEVKCWMDCMPQEIMLMIFSYLPLGMLLQTIPQVCKKWEVLALDWTLWKRVEDLTIKNMVISTAKLRTLLRVIPRLKKLELIQRNDAEELLSELFEANQNLEVLKLDRCYRSNSQMNMLSQTVTSMLLSCPKLKTVMLTDTHFHSKNFYRCLAKKFRSIERINVTCTTKSEMNVLVENLKESVPEVEFQRVPMMGRAEGKHIYWGPILGLVIRPIPTSPFYQQFMHDSFPSYAF